MTKHEIEISIRFWLREGEGLARREAEATESVSAKEWQAHDDAAAALIEALAVLWGITE